MNTRHVNHPLTAGHVGGYSRTARPACRACSAENGFFKAPELPKSHHGNKVSLADILPVARAYGKRSKRAAAAAIAPLKKVFSTRAAKDLHRRACEALLAYNTPYEAPPSAC